MPTYDYACQSCGHDLEIFQRMSDDPIITCPSCEEPALKRKIGVGAGIIFKGGGFYETDFKQRKGKPESETKDKSETPKGENKDSGGKKDTSTSKSPES